VLKVLGASSLVFRYPLLLPSSFRFRRGHFHSCHLDCKYWCQIVAKRSGVQTPTAKKAGGGVLDFFPDSRIDDFITPEGRGEHTQNKTIFPAVTPRLFAPLVKKTDRFLSSMKLIYMRWMLSSVGRLNSLLVLFFVSLVLWQSECVWQSWTFWLNVNTCQCFCVHCSLYANMKNVLITSTYWFFGSRYSGLNTSVVKTVWHPKLCVGLRFVTFMKIRKKSLFTFLSR